MKLSEIEAFTKEDLKKHGAQCEFLDWIIADSCAEVWFDTEPQNKGN